MPNIISAFQTTRARDPSFSVGVITGYGFWSDSPNLNVGCTSTVVSHQLVINMCAIP